MRSALSPLSENEEEDVSKYLLDRTEDEPVVEGSSDVVAFNETINYINASHKNYKKSFFKKSPPKQFKVLLVVVATLAIGGLNRVAGKIVTVPMGEYSFFLSIFNSILYVIFYGAILLVRLFTKAITLKDLKAVWTFYPETEGNFMSRVGPWKYFLLTGSLDGLNNILVLISSAYLPGALIALLNQTNVLFSMISALILLRSRFTFWEVWSVGLLFAGIAATLIPEFDDLHSLHSGLLHYSIMMGLSTLPQAVSVTLKEKLLRPQNPTSKGIDLFVVNSHTSFFQMLLIPLFIPLTIPFDQTNGKPLDEYIKNGFRCFAGYNPIDSFSSLPASPCHDDPYPYIIYISINLIYNILILILIKVASGVLCFMTLQAVLPLSVVLFYIPWPLIVPDPFSGWTVSGLVVGMVALGLFQFFSVEKKRHQLSCFSCSLPAFDLYLSKRPAKV